MATSLTHLKKKRIRNSQGLSAFGIDVSKPSADSDLRTVREGNGPTIYTVGYERRSGEQLISTLIDAGVNVLVDVRQRAMSRRADFRGAALKARCEQAGLAYKPMQNLGSTDILRDELKRTGDIDAFHKAFRQHAEVEQKETLEQLAIFSKGRGRTIALICYERAHEDCHRSTVADMLADEVDATIVAIG